VRLSVPGRSAAAHRGPFPATERVPFPRTLRVETLRLPGGVDTTSGLTSAQYSQPVLGLIFLRFADARFAARRAELEKASSSRRGSSSSRCSRTWRVSSTLSGRVSFTRSRKSCAIWELPAS